VRSARRAAALTVSLLALGAGPAAASSSYTKVLHAYEAQGTVPACQFNAATLEAALHGVDVYGQQYFADFTGAIQTALAQRASGQCTSSAAPAASGARSQGNLRLTLPAVTAATSAGPPLPLLALIVLGIVAALVAAVAGVRRRLGYEGGPWRQLWGEAAWRSEGWLAEQRDRRVRRRLGPR
jgi:hypothetical protein